MNLICLPGVPGAGELTHEYEETHGCILSTVATDALVLKHQTISTHSSYQICIVFDHFHRKILHLKQTTLEKEIIYLKKNPVVSGLIFSWSTHIMSQAPTAQLSQGPHSGLAS